MSIPTRSANLGPLRPLAGVWRAEKGVDLNPKAGGPERRIFIETIHMHPIDPQTNGPQLLYGMRYHIHINTAEEDITFHEQVGYWLWEPATGLVMQTLAIPRGQVALAAGHAKADDKTFFVAAKRGETITESVRPIFSKSPSARTPTGSTSPATRTTAGHT